jgi:hypothetical protein
MTQNLNQDITQSATDKNSHSVGPDRGPEDGKFNE